MTQNPPVIPPVPVQLDRERHFVLTMASLRRAELRLRTLTGEKDLSILKVLVDTTKRGMIPGLTELSVILWAGLVDEDATLTDEQVLALLTLDRISAAVRAFNEATDAFFTPADGDGQAAGPLASTGSPSGASAAAASPSLTGNSGA